MAFNIFSKRMKQQRGEVPDVYQYTEIPRQLRVQLIHTFSEAIGKFDAIHNQEVRGMADWIIRKLCKEYGLFELPGHTNRHDHNDCTTLFNFILQEEDHERVLDAVELLLTLVVDSACRKPHHSQLCHPLIDPDSAIAEVNQRFRENGVGYQYESNEIIRVDSQIVHESAVKPVMALLRAREYQGPNEEFLRAHEHYRHGRHAEALNDALKAFESTMKAICSKRRWKYGPTDTAKPLLDLCFQNNLIPAYLQNHYASLRAGLEGGVPTVRNKLGGHGQGPVSVEIPAHFVAYQLHLTASAILFLIECEKSLN